MRSDLSRELSELRAARDRITANIIAFADMAETGGFAPGRANQAGLFHDEFVRTARRAAQARGSADPEEESAARETIALPWEYVFSLAGDLYEHAKRPAAAAAVVIRLLELQDPSAPEGWRERLESAKRALVFQERIGRLRMLRETKNFVGARGLSKQMLQEETDLGNIDDINNIVTEIAAEEIGENRLRKLGIWVACAALFLVTISSFAHSYFRSLIPESPIATAAPVPNRIIGQEAGVIAPEPNSGRLIGRAQYRFCALMLKGLRDAGPQIDKSDIYLVGQYKASVDDYLNRCSARSVTDSDRAFVDQEINAGAGGLVARNMLERWTRERPVSPTTDLPADAASKP